MLEKTLKRVPWTARSNHLILKEINPLYSLEGLMLKLKLQYFWPPVRRADSLEKTLMLGKIEGRRRRGQWRTRWLDGHQLKGHEFQQTPGDGEGPGSLACCGPWDYEELRDWTTTSILQRMLKINILEYIFLGKKWSRELLNTTKLPPKGYPFILKNTYFLYPQ